MDLDLDTNTPMRATFSTKSKFCKKVAYLGMRCKAKPTHYLHYPIGLITQPTKRYRRYGHITMSLAENTSVRTKIKFDSYVCPKLKLDVVLKRFQFTKIKKTIFYSKV